jgi:hypothetical protein
MVRDGELLKADAAPSPAVGIHNADVGRIADLLLEGQVSVARTNRPLSGLHTNGLPSNAVALYTSAWGNGDRSYVTTSGAVVEVVVQSGKVTEVRAEKTRQAGAGGWLCPAGRRVGGHGAPGHPAGSTSTSERHRVLGTRP